MPGQDKDEDWGPATSLWAAAIIADGQNAPDRADHRIRQVTWASHGEALDFLRRRMPTTAIPDQLDHRNRRRIVGEIRAASLVTTWVGCEIIEWVVVAEEITTIASLVQESTKIVDDGMGGSTTRTQPASIRFLDVPASPPVATAA